MPLSHEDLIFKNDDKLLKAIIDIDLVTMHNLCHKDIVFTNEVGKTFCGVKNLQMLQNRNLTIDKICILHRDLAMFGATAVISSMERRSGSYMSSPLHGNYHMTRIWKFGSSWQLISTTSVSVG